jgi:predicted RNA-binding protein with PIN domain
VSRGHIIVDGYNVLHAHPVLGPALRDDLDAARTRFVSELSGYAENSGRTIVVFDGAGNPASDGTPHHLGRLTVIFSKAGTSADATIEALAHRFRGRGEEVLVVTSDGATRDTVRSGGVTVRPAAEFVAELATILAEGSDAAVPARRRVPVAERIDDGVATALARWARGESPTGPGD